MLIASLRFAPGVYGGYDSREEITGTREAVTSFLPSCDTKQARVFVCFVSELCSPCTNICVTAAHADEITIGARKAASILLPEAGSGEAGAINTVAWQVKLRSLSHPLVPSRS